MAAAVSLNRGGVQPAGGILPAEPAGSRASTEGPAPRCASRSAQQTALPHHVCSICSGPVHLGRQAFFYLHAGSALSTMMHHLVCGHSLKGGNLLRVCATHNVSISRKQVPDSTRILTTRLPCRPQ